MLSIAPLPRTDETAAVVTCGSGHPNVVGGGFRDVSGIVASSFPSGTGTWTVVLAAPEVDSDWTAYAVCSK